MKSKSQSKPGRPSRRQEIVAATEALIRTKGLAGVTTRAIAEKAGCSEAALYVHFKGRLELLLAVLQEALPTVLAPLKVLEASVGSSTPHRNLAQAFRSIYEFHERAVPLFGSLIADPELLAAFRESLTGRPKDSHGLLGTVQRYIVAEQKLDRISRDVDSEIAATMLISTSFFGAFLDGFFEGRPSPSGAPIRRLSNTTTINRFIAAAIGEWRGDPSS